MDVSTNRGMSCTWTFFTTKATAAFGRVYLHYRGLSCTGICLETETSPVFDLSTLQRPVLHFNVLQKRPALFCTTVSCAAPLGGPELHLSGHQQPVNALIYIKDSFAALDVSTHCCLSFTCTCLHYRVLCCTQMCLLFRGLSCTCTCLHLGVLSFCRF